jgi:RimJ/RimL family protein N-acetyltransferase
MAETRDAVCEVRLRPVEDQDLGAFFELQADPEANEMAAFPARGQEQFAAHWAKVRADDTAVLRTIVAAHNAGSIRVLEKCGFRRDRVQEATAPAPDDGIEKFIFVLGA